MLQENSFDRFSGRQKPKPVSTGTVFRTQTDIMCDRSQLIKPLQNRQPADYVLPKIDDDIIEGEIVGDTGIQVKPNDPESSIVILESLTDFSQSDLAEIVGENLVSMENRSQSEILDVEKSVELLKTKIAELKKIQEILQTNLNIQESSIELNQDFKVADVDIHKMISLKKAIRQIEFKVLSCMSRIQYAINKSQGIYIDDVRNTMADSYDITFVGKETEDSEVIDIIINSIAQDTKYENSGSEKIFEPVSTITGINYNLYIMAKNIILNKNTTLEQAKKLVRSVSNKSKPRIIMDFLKLSPLLNPIGKEVKSGGMFRGSNKDNEYTIRIAPIIIDFLDGLDYSVRQVAMKEIKLNDVNQQRAIVLQSLIIQTSREKDPDEISNGEKLWTLLNTKIF
jgi:hypothetical protein